MKKELFTAVANRLLDSTLIKSVDLQNGQFQNPDGFNSRAYPAALIEFLQIKRLIQGDYNIIWQIVIQMSYAFASVENSEMNFSNRNMKRVSELETTEKLANLLDGWSPFEKGSSSIQIINEKQDTDYQTVSVWTQDLTLSVSCVPKEPKP